MQTGFDPSAMAPGNDPNDLMRRLAQMLRDVGFGPSAALRRLLGGAVNPTGFLLDEGGGGRLGGGSGGSGGGGGTGGGSGGGGPLPPIPNLPPEL